VGSTESFEERMRLRVGSIVGRIVVLALAAAGPLAAQVPDSTADSTAKKRVTLLDAAVVTATRTSQAVRDVPANVAVFGTADLQRSAARSVSDFLRVIPGYTTKDYQSSLVAHPSRQAPALRGLGGTSASRTLVLLDGIPMNEPFAGWVHWPRVPMALVRQAEVVRGGGAGVWGDRALGGVINLLTEDPSSTSLSLGASGGSFGTVRTNAVATARLDRLGLLASADYIETDGFKNVRSDLRGPIDAPVDSRDVVVYGKAMYDVTPLLRVHLSASHMDDFRNNGTVLKYDATTLSDVRGGLRWVTGSGGVLSGTAYTSRTSHTNYFTSESLDRSSETPSLDQFDVPATAFGTQLQYSITMFERHRLTAGTDLSWVKGEVNEDFNFAQGSFTRRRHVAGDEILRGGYLQDVVQLGSSTQVLLSARYDAWRISDAIRAEHNIQTGAPTLDSAYVGVSSSRMSYSVGLRQQASSSLSLRGSVYSSFRSPTLNELYKPFRETGNVITESNPSLEPERLTGLDIGADYALSNGFVARVTGFWSRVDDPILEVTLATAGTTGRIIAPCGFVPAGGACRQRRNVGAFRTLGVETELEGRLHRTLMLRGSWVYNPTEVIEAPTQPALVGKIGKGTAKHQATVSAFFENPTWFDLSLTTRYVGARYDDDMNSLHLESFFVSDARLARRITAKSSIFVAVENLFDREYPATRAASGIVRLGSPRLAEAGLRYRW
jgi:outer membrane cobalamin receptor